MQEDEIYKRPRSVWSCCIYIYTEFIRCVRWRLSPSRGVKNTVLYLSKNKRVGFRLWHVRAHWFAINNYNITTCRFAEMCALKNYNFFRRCAEIILSYSSKVFLYFVYRRSTIVLILYYTIFFLLYWNEEMFYTQRVQ